VMNSSSGVTPSISNLPLSGSTYTIDKTAPTVSSIAATSALVTKATTTYTVTFSEAVTGVDASDFTATKTGTVTSGTIAVTPSSSSVYSVSVAGVAGDGSLRLDLNGSGTGITDASGNAISGGFTGGSTYTIDNTSPTLSISPPTVTYANSGSFIDYTVTYNDANLGTLPSQPIGALAVFENTTFNGTSLGSLQVFNSVGNTVKIEYHGITGDGTLAFTVPAGTTNDQAGNPALASPLSPAVIIDNTAPSITIGAPSVATTKGGPVSYTITYNDANFNTSALGTGNITLNTTGTATGTVAVSGSGTSYTVTISSTSGDGTLGFTIGAGTATDLAGNTAAASSASSTFTVDNTAPTVQSITATTPSNTNPTNATSVAYTVTFSEAVSGVDGSAFTGNNLTGSVSYSSITVNPVSSSVYTVTINGLSGDGTMRLDFTNGGSAVQDATGNTAATFTGSDVYTIDNTPPTALTLTYSSNHAGNSQIAVVGDVVSLDFTTSETITAPTVSIAGHAVTAANVSGNEWLASYTMTSGDAKGRIPFSLSFSDLAGNPQPGAPYTDVAAGDDIELLNSDASLSNLTLAVGFVKHPNFVSTTFNYASFVGAAISTDTFTPTSTDGNATISVNGLTVTSGSPSQPITLKFGQNLVTIVVTAQDGSTTQTYTDTLYRALSTNSNLLTLKTNHGPLSPTFSNTTLAYTLAVGYGVSSITFTGTTVDANATMTVGGSATASATASVPQSLNVGDNVIDVVVTAQDGSSKTFETTVTRAKSTNSNLLTLVTNHGVLTPGFSNSTLSYTKAVNTGVSSITFTATTADPTATITVGGGQASSGNASVPQPLIIGDNVIDVVVTAQDGSSKTFEVTVTRAKSSNDKLYTIVSNRGGLTQTSPGAPTYTKNVNYAFSTINFTVTSVDPNATITVGGTPTPSGTASVDQPLNVGDNPIAVVITAQDGVTSQTYTVTVTRAAQPLNSGYIPVAVSNPSNSLEFLGDGIKVHEGLSPNGDGVNDFLLIEGINNHPDNKLQIMNRSGQLVFEAKGYDNSTKVFDGHSNKNGQMQLPGTYFYSLDYTDKGETKHKTGFIVLKY
jgi:gliding motility-associated-like protein